MFKLKVQVTVKVVEFKELESTLDDLLRMDTDVVSMPNLAKKLGLTPKAALSACRALAARDCRYAFATGLDGARLLHRVPVAATRRASVFWRLVDLVGFRARWVRRDVHKTVAYRACLRHHMDVLHGTLLTIEQRVRGVLQCASTDDCDEVRRSQARHIVQLRFDLARLSALEAHLQQRSMIFDQHLDDLATAAFVRECPVPLPLSEVLLRTAKTAETAREELKDMLYLSSQAVELSPPVMNEQYILAFEELAASAELKRQHRTRLTH